MATTEEIQGYLSTLVMLLETGTKASQHCKEVMESATEFWSRYEKTKTRGDKGLEEIVAGGTTVAQTYDQLADGIATMKYNLTLLTENLTASDALECLTTIRDQTTQLLELATSLQEAMRLSLEYFQEYAKSRAPRDAKANQIAANTMIALPSAEIAVDALNTHLVCVGKVHAALAESD